MNECPIILSSNCRPGDLVEIARSLRRLHLNIETNILAGPPVEHQHNAHGLIEAISPHRDHLQDAADAVIDGKDPSEHLMLAAAWSLRPGLAQRISEGGRQKYVDILNSNADRIIKALDTQVLRPALKTMRALSVKHPDQYWNLRAAVDSQDFQQAQRIKDQAALCLNLRTMYRIRELLHPDAFDTDAAWAQEPGILDHLGDPQPGELSWWMQAINANFTPWFPTISEWQALDESEPFTEYRESVKPAEMATIQLGFTGR